MKIRLGFVSNSSSASFILSISNDKRNKNICKFLHDNLPQYFEKKGLMKAIQLDISEDKNELKNIKIVKKI